MHALFGDLNLFGLAQILVIVGVLNLWVCHYRYDHKRHR